MVSPTDCGDGMNDTAAVNKDLTADTEFSLVTHSFGIMLCQL